MPDTHPEPKKLTIKSTPSPYSSPLLDCLSADMRPDPMPACGTCPAAMWRATRTRIECLCRTAGRISWEGRQEPTLFCDGREAAIARLTEEG